MNDQNRMDQQGQEEMNRGQQGMGQQGQNQWRCDNCGATFTNQEEFDKHNRVHVEEEETTRTAGGGGRREMEGGRDLS
jgi:hypothetical protein